MSLSRIFLLSPASCGGERARLLLDDQARFELAVRLRSPGGAPLGSVFSFVSGLYFRGKLTYARTFARSQGRVPGILVITPTRGLARPEERITRDDLVRLGSVPVELTDPRYREPLEASVRALAARLPLNAEVILLGSIATGKYLDVLAEHLGERLHFPADFIGRGDMSRGALLRAVQEQRELVYVPASGAVRRGRRVSGFAHAS